MDDRQNRFVDELLDASLRNYTSAPPRPGLESRVLAGVRARQQTARRHAAWGVGLAAVAAWVTLLVVHRPRPHPAPLPVIANASPNISAPSVAKVTLPAQPTMPRRPPRTAPPGRMDTRPQQFPTPRPLSEQEKLLLAYVQSLKASSAASLQMTEESSEHDLEIPPLSIAEIKIEPLAPPKEIGGEQ